MKRVPEPDAICLLCNERGIHAHTITRSQEAGMQPTIMVGSVLYGYCSGVFGRDGYGPHRVEAIGADWIVVRRVEDGVPFSATEDPSRPPGTLLRWLAEALSVPDGVPQ